MNYRAEVDGLRAVAVIPVILFHAGFDLFRGGFVGVDVFFVISGYLITTIILSEKEQGTFSIVNFYERRARRILPALFLVMAVSVVCAWLWLLPSDMKDFAQSLVAVSFFSSNILFWQETGYWGVQNELKPLLHTWSLAVEEQYYFIFPIFLMLMWRFRKRWIFGSFIVIAITSLIASHWAAYNRPSANFFLLITRGWELATGACIAFYFLYRKPTLQRILSNKLIDEAMGILGLLLIAYSVIMFDETVPFPSLYALIPTVGTALIIVFASKATLIGRMLSTRLLVSVGLISYSAYLWHQPIFAFARHQSLSHPSEVAWLLLSLLSLFLAYLSWRYIETPFRNKSKFSRKAIFSFWLVGSIIFVGIGITGHITKGFSEFPLRTQANYEELDAKWKKNHGMSAKCEDKFKLIPECQTSDSPEILVWGDSYAMHIVEGILASNPEVKLIQMTKSVCGPFFDIAPTYTGYPISWAQGCLDFTGEVKAWLENNKSIKYVAISSSFVHYLNETHELLHRNGEIEKASIETTSKALLSTLNYIESLGLKPVVFSPPPSTGKDKGRCLAKAEWLNLDLNVCNFSKDDLASLNKQALALMNEIEKSYPVIRLDHIICDKSNCSVSINDTWIYRDKGHLSIEGARLLGIKHDFYGRITQPK